MISSFLRRFVPVGVIVSLLVPVSLFSASNAKVVKFEIITPPTARTNEAIDVTVQALDKDNQVVTDYLGSIIFVPDNPGDTVPMQGRGIAFTKEDAGKKKFSKGMVFKSVGNAKIYVTDVSDDISGEATVKVEAGSTTGNSSSGSAEEVILLTPQNNSQITTDLVMVSGKTRKNSKVTLSLDGKDAGSAQTDENGLFTKSLSGGSQGKHILSASVVNSDGSVIGKLSDINFEKVANVPNFYSLVITPTENIRTSDMVKFTVETDPAMASVMIGIDGSQIEAKIDSDPKKYTAMIPAPTKSGSYQVDVTITDSVGQTLNKKNAGSITVLDPLPQAKAEFQNVKIVTTDGRATFTFGVSNPPDALSKFKIAYGTAPESFTEESLTYTKDKISKDGTYTWYIDKLSPQMYYFKIYGVNTDGSLIDTLVSEVQSATIGGKQTCSIGNVGDVQVETLRDKSILSWTALSGALSYNIYKVSPSGDYVFFQNTKDAKYVLFLSSGALTEQNFAIKALCDESTMSPDYKMVSKVRTGPGLIAFVIILSAITAAILLRKRAMRI